MWWTKITLSEFFYIQNWTLRLRHCNFIVKWIGYLPSAVLRCRKRGFSCFNRWLSDWQTQKKGYCLADWQKKTVWQIDAKERDCLTDRHKRKELSGRQTKKECLTDTHQKKSFCPPVTQYVSPAALLEHVCKVWKKSAHGQIFAAQWWVEKKINDGPKFTLFLVSWWRWWTVRKRDKNKKSERQRATARLVKGEKRYLVMDSDEMWSVMAAECGWRCDEKEEIINRLHVLRSMILRSSFIWRRNCDDEETQLHEYTLLFFIFWPGAKGEVTLERTRQRRRVKCEWRTLNVESEWTVKSNEKRGESKLYDGYVPWFLSAESNYALLHGHKIGNTTEVDL